MAYFGRRLLCCTRRRSWWRRSGWWRWRRGRRWRPGRRGRKNVRWRALRYAASLALVTGPASAASAVVWLAPRLTAQREPRRNALAGRAGEACGGGAVAWFYAPFAAVRAEGTRRALAKAAAAAHGADGTSNRGRNRACRRGARARGTGMDGRHTHSLLALLALQKEWHCLVSVSPRSRGVHVSGCLCFASAEHREQPLHSIFEG